MLLGILLTGFAMGLASSLHCAGMCGPIACGLLIAGGGRSPLLAATLQTLTAQAGRIAGYMAAGAAFGIFGVGLYGSINLESAHQLMQ